MKKILMGCLALFVAITLCGCGSVGNYTREVTLGPFTVKVDPQWVEDNTYNNIYAYTDGKKHEGSNYEKTYCTLYLDRYDTSPEAYMESQKKTALDYSNGITEDYTYEKIEEKVINGNQAVIYKTTRKFAPGSATSSIDGYEALLVKRGSAMLVISSPELDIARGVLDTAK